MKSNRAARKALGMPYKVSNTRCRTPEDDANGWPTDKYRRHSRHRHKAKRKVEEMRIERHFERNLKDGMTCTDAYAAAVRVVRGQHTQGERS